MNFYCNFKDFLGGRAIKGSDRYNDIALALTFFKAEPSILYHA